MWYPFKKKVETKPRKIYIPESEIERVLTLLDVYISAPTNCDRVKRYKLWKFIAKICPETSEGRWALVTRGAATLHPYVEEEL